MSALFVRARRPRSSDSSNHLRPQRSQYLRVLILVTSKLLLKCCQLLQFLEAFCSSLERVLVHQRQVGAAGRTGRGTFRQCGYCLAQLGEGNVVGALPKLERGVVHESKKSLAFQQRALQPLAGDVLEAGTGRSVNA